MAQDPHDKNPFELLGLQGDEDLAAIRKAFLKIAAQYHPDRLRSKSPEERDKGLAYFLEAKKAFELLSLPDKRRDWSERLARAKASASPQAPPPASPPASSPPASSPPAPGAPASGAPAPGPRTASPAAPGAPHTSAVSPPAAPRVPSAPPLRVPSSPGTAALQLYKMGMIALESRDYGKALELFTKASKLAPTPRNQAMEMVCRGHQLLSTRFFDKARESFDRALELLPDCREARAALELLEKQRQSSRYTRR